MNLVPQVLRSLKNLPPFPTVAHRALLLFNQPQVSIEELVEVVKFDPAITANIIRICNSAYFARHRGIQSLHEAFLLLGTHELLKIIVLSGVTRLFAEPTPGYYRERLGLWRHSVSCALMMDSLAQKLSLANHATGFTAGLLHDVGKVVLGLFVEEKFEEIMEVVEKQDVSFRAGEKMVLGIDHAEMGGEMARLWNFPDSLRMSIAYHHLDRPEAFAEELILLVYLADQLALMVGEDLGPDGLVYTGHPEVLSHFKLQEPDLENILLEFGARWDESQACFGLSPELEKNPQAQIES
jgi:putative nucleotidyltransferase with HDIG domain